MVPADAFPPPVHGQCLASTQGEVWQIVEVIHSMHLEGFYILRICRTDSLDQCLLLDRREYQAFCRAHGLEPVRAS